MPARRNIMSNHYGKLTTAYASAAYISAALLIAGGISVVFIPNAYIGAAEMAAGVVIFLLMLILRGYRRNIINSYLNHIEKSSGVMASNPMNALPVPAAACHIDGTVKWYNEMFADVFGNDDLYETKIEDVIPAVKWGTILKTPSIYQKQIKIDDKSFLFAASAVKSKQQSVSRDEDKVSVYIYLIDKTTENEIQAKYDNERTDVAIINIDNYDDVLQRVNDSERQQILSHIRQCVSEWAAESDAIVKSTDRDRYYVLFEHRFLQMYEDKKFDILNKVRNIGDEIKLPVSISIGIGISGTLAENDTYARNALDIALGRGGDQVSIKNDIQYRFYGGTARDYEKSTRVKTRAFAVALKDFIKKSDKVILMGHSSADYDCFGAAIGLQRAVRALGKTPYIVVDNNSPAIKTLYNDIRENEEYQGMFVDGDRALELLTPDTLVIVLDTHRPSMLPCQALVHRASKVILIDHHRRSTDFISPCSLIYHEPYASSTCEMATELLEYMDLGSALTSIEAESLYTGILIDTKNFMVKTGVRTFEAASYLRRLGLNTVGIKRLFNVSKEDYIYRSDIVKTAEVIAPHIAVARCYGKIPNVRVIASQASDEMLNIADIHASIVVYPLDGAISVSARSLGDINVQLIMEKLGGGGHSTVAGAQIKDKTVDMVVEDVKDAVYSYIADQEN